MIRPLPSLVMLGLFATSAFAQIKVEGRPATERVILEPSIPTFTMKVPDLEEMKREDEANGFRPYRYGAVIPTVIATDFAGKWDVLEDGTRVWRVRVVSPGAFTIGLVFDKWNLPDGAELYVYDDARSEVNGAYTSVNNAPNGQLQIEPILGDTINVEYVVPPTVTHDRLLQIGQVIHDYRHIRKILTGGPLGGSPCLRDIVCPEGANYQDVKRATVRTLASGALCSGAILTDTTHSGTPYLYTANHCGSMTNAVFTFQYENTSCGGGGASGSKTLSGSQHLLSNANNDSAFFRLNQTIPSTYQPYYAGWDRSSSTGAPVVAITHGNGEPKQIAVDNNGASSAGSQWACAWNSGIVLGGSSGGPLYNSSKRVIGCACCVDNFNCGAQTTWFNKFSSFWNLGLAQWLDPNGSGVTFTNGFDPALSCGSVTTTGPGCAGSCGITPAFALSGCFDANGAVNFSISQGLGGQQAFVFLGTSSTPLPLGCSCNLNVSGLLPSMFGPFPLSGLFCVQGAISLNTTLPSTIAPGTLYMAAVTTDNVNSCGYTTTNGLKVIFN